ncbi:MAG: hypothetical protein KC464_05505, partial [Myxococcales bacterium]|nr:hypothetical protein [Myxococcales bacterium]
MPRVRRWFAAPLVVTLAGPAACSSSGGQRRSPIDDFAYVSRDGSACIYHVDMACPPNATCNPPPPQAVECPAGMGADVTGARVGRHGDGCVAVIPPCADLACAVPTPCPTPGAPLPALQWAVNPAGTFDDAGAGL